MKRKRWELVLLTLALMVLVVPIAEAQESVQWLYYNARLSPGGERVAVAVGREGDSETQIFVVGVDSHSVELVLGPDGRTNNFPAWSIDGTKIAFSSCPRGGGVGLRSGSCRSGSVGRWNSRDSSA